MEKKSPPKRKLVSERSRSENQERAFISASRRTDRSLNDRLRSAQKASLLHQARTGKALHITKEIVAKEAMYEEISDRRQYGALPPIQRNYAPLFDDLISEQTTLFHKTPLMNDLSPNTARFHGEPSSNYPLNVPGAAGQEEGPRASLSMPLADGSLANRTITTKINDLINPEGLNAIIPSLNNSRIPLHERRSCDTALQGLGLCLAEPNLTCACAWFQSRNIHRGEGTCPKDRFKLLDPFHYIAKEFHHPSAVFPPGEIQVSPQNWQRRQHAGSVSPCSIHGNLVQPAALSHSSTGIYSLDGRTSDEILGHTTLEPSEDYVHEMDCHRFEMHLSTEIPQWNQFACGDTSQNVNSVSPTCFNCFQGADSRSTYRHQRPSLEIHESSGILKYPA